ncbi:MAG: SDR family oxidoreductase [Pseudomonadota bacterium]
MTKLVCIGAGYSARPVAEEMRARGWDVAGTSRSDDGVAGLKARGLEAVRFADGVVNDDLGVLLDAASHVLVSVAPDPDPAVGDSALEPVRARLAARATAPWVGYLSTVGVYGDHEGAWVDETTAPRPASQRSKARVATETAWMDWADAASAPLQIYRLSGIYGPGRSPVDRLRAGKARRLVKPGQVFNRIHVDDIRAAVIAGLDGCGTHRVYNVTDDLPAPPQDVIAYAADCLGIAPPPEIDFATADLSPMARSFYGENKRVANARMKDDLGVALSFPTYREGIAALAGSVG